MKDNYLTVSALTKYIKRKIDIDPHLKNIWLKGEISNFNHHSRGHMYLTIKDSETRIQAVMFAGNNRHLKFRPENGMRVLIKGEVSVFEAFGQYQLYIHHMEPDGLGSLYLAYEQLKEKLAAKGYFSDEHKQQIPKFPKHIGIITSPTGAAVRDILTTIQRRYPLASTTVIPTLVQGSVAAESIKKSIELANHSIDFDVLIVGRGGGSIEDLWSFNEEIVAEAIYNSKIPIISAVGHETDQTISDYVADLRAPTPTSAAEIAVPSQLELKEKIHNTQISLQRVLNHMISSEKQRLTQLNQSYGFRYVDHLVSQKEQQLDQYTDKLAKSLTQFLSSQQTAFRHVHSRLLMQHPKSQLSAMSKVLTQYKKQLHSAFDQIVKAKQQILSVTLEKLILLNPLETMKRGFAIPYTKTGEIIKTFKQVKTNEEIVVTLSDGTIDCQVLHIKENN